MSDTYCQRPYETKKSRKEMNFIGTNVSRFRRRNIKTRKMKQIVSMRNFRITPELKNENILCKTKDKVYQNYYNFKMM